MLPYFQIREISLGPVTIQVWGLMAVLGFLLALFISTKEAERKNIDEENIWDVMILALVGMIAGSKIFYLFSNFGKHSDISGILNFGGGFSFLGGLVLSAVAVYVYARIKKINIWKLADVLTPGAIFAIIAIRVGCFLVYDHVGKITGLSWGAMYIDGTLRHPVSLYLVIKNIIALFLVIYLKKKNLKEGVLFLAFALYYSVVGFFLDFARCSDLAICDSRFWNLTYTQWLLLIAAPFIFYALAKKRGIIND